MEAGASGQQSSTGGAQGTEAVQGRAVFVANRARDRSMAGAYPVHLLKEVHLSRSHRPPFTLPVSALNPSGVSAVEGLGSVPGTAGPF